MGWVKDGIVYRALDESCKAHSPHTFGSNSRVQIPVYLIVVSLARGLLRAGKGLPCPFSLVWVPLQVFGQRQEFGFF